MHQPINVLVWNENVEEFRKPEVRAHYPNGIHHTIAEVLAAAPNLQVETATMDQPDAGLSETLLSQTDVLVWWSHHAVDQVPENATRRVKRRVLEGMGLILLHSAILSRLFKDLIGGTCAPPWRNVAERETIWTVSPNHPIAEGIEFPIHLDQEEMYGEPFDVPSPDELIFLSWFEGGEVFRSGMCYLRGNSRIFYFRPGHETYPTYLNPKVQQLLRNAVFWAEPQIKTSSVVRDFGRDGGLS